MSNKSSLARRAASRYGLGLAMLAIASGWGWSADWLSSGGVDPVGLVKAFEDVNSVHPGFRRNHPKGVCFVGWFDSSGAGARLSRAAVFRPGRIPVLGRFSTGARTPETPDTFKIVRSMALSLKLPNGEVWRTAMNSTPVFHVKDAQALLDHLVALKPDPATGKPDPAGVANFMAAHPASARAIAQINATPVSSGFANTSFNSLNAFRLVNADGKETAVRWSMQPVDAFEPQPPEVPPEKHHLFEALAARLQQGPVQWRLILVVGRPGDPTNDATLSWPADREKVDAGTLTVIAIEREADGRCRDMVFDPMILPPGIEPSDDPLLSARSAAYAVSFGRRMSERKNPGAVRGGEKPDP